MKIKYVKTAIIFTITTAVILVQPSCTTEPICGHEETTCRPFINGLKDDMTYDDIIRIFGPPADDIGSGIHIYVYPFKDGTSVYIGFTDRIYYQAYG